MDNAIMPVENIEKLIHIIRGKKVIIDHDLARLYDVSTKRLNEQIKRNRERFPEDFMFQLRNQEVANLRSQFATSSSHGGRRYLPFAFTEHGAVMAANVLSSKRAIAMSIFVVRAFINLKGALKLHRELKEKLNELEHRLSTHDKAIRSLFTAIKKLMPEENKKKRPVGFRVGGHES